MSINRVTITGNLTRDPQLRMTTNGTQVMNFGVAVNDRRRNSQTGEWEDRPNFVDCVLFGQRAESLSRFLTKGAKVAIEGKLRQNTWESDGQRRSRLEIIVDDIDLMSRRQDGGQSRSYGGAQVAPSPNQGYQGGYQDSRSPNYAAPAPSPSYNAPHEETSQTESSSQSAGAPMPPEGTVYDEDIPF